MLTIVHFLVGALVGKYLESVWLVIIIAFFSHYALDMIPHHSYSGPKGCGKNLLSRAYISKIPKWRFLEPLLGIILILILMYFNKDKAVLMYFGSLFAFLPDLFSFVAWKHDITFLNKILPRPENVFYTARNTLFGILTHIIIGAAAFIGLVLNLSS